MGGEFGKRGGIRIEVKGKTVWLKFKLSKENDPPPSPATLLDFSEDIVVF